jgi:hypothetical protein
MPRKSHAWSRFRDPMAWRSSSSLVLLLALFVAGSEPPARSDEPPGETGRADRLQAMRAIADQITIDSLAPERRRREERIAEPVYRYNDPARVFSDGTVWAWGRSGRPVALLTVASARGPQGNLYWLGELTSLAPVPLASAVPGSGFWAPAGPGVEPRPIPQAPPPADSEAKRLRQMKELARRFRAFEFFAARTSPTTERYELRLLPQPIHRYADRDSGLIDGTMFFITYGTNPEIVLLVEARRTGGAEPVWSYGLARIAGAELHVELDEREIWTRSKEMGPGARDPYWIFVRPL